MEGFSIAAIFELIFAGIATGIAGLVEETVLAAARSIIDLLLGIFPGLVQ